jgi:ABC-2 type transport system ATP-binding protein
MTNTALPADVAEIQSFLDHGDYSLAVRRLLDKSFDSEDETLIRKAIECSQLFHKLLHEQDNNNFLSQARYLVNALALVTQNFQPQLLLKANEISKTYTHGSFSLKPISLEIFSGNILGIVGENGNGKTTLLRCLAGQLNVKGNINYYTLPKVDYYTVKHHVAFIPQRIPKWYGFLKDNLHFSAAICGITGKQNNLMVEFMLERLHLNEYAHLTWQQISSGYRTRFEIARILLQQPNLLILDEPLANLDIKAQQTLLTDLQYLAKSTHHPLGVILSSQQLHEVEKAADKVLLIKNGICAHTTVKNNIETVAGFVVEIETSAERDVLSDLFKEDVTLHFNGGFYTLTSYKISGAQILQQLVQNNIPVQYYRDITNSTKRYF